MLAFFIGGAAGGLLGHLMFGSVLPAAACACLFGVAISAMTQSRVAQRRGYGASSGEGGDSAWSGSGDGWSSGGDCSDGGGGDGGGCD